MPYSVWTVEYHGFLIAVEAHTAAEAEKLAAFYLAGRVRAAA